MSRPLTLALLLLAAAPAALAAPVYTNSVFVAYDPAAPLGNFGTPGTTNHVTGYTIQTGQDSSRIYVRLVADAAPGSAGVEFANLYFGQTGSFVGFEVTNNLAFRPGVPGYTDFSGTGVTWTQAPGEITFALPFSFLTGDPLNLGFNPISAAPGDDYVLLRLSQSFGYSVAGGASYGPDRLGRFTLPSAAAVPEPASLALLGLGLAGLAGLGRRRAG